MSDEPEDLMALIEASPLGDRLQADLERVGQPYFMAMVHGQMLEVFCKLVAPTLAGPRDDDTAAEASVATAFKRTLHQAIEEIEKLAATHQVPVGLVQDLHAARHLRNDLAHDGLWLVFQRLLAGDADGAIAELVAAEAVFVDLLQRVRDLMTQCLEERGLSAEDAATVSDRIGAALIVAPEHFDGMPLKPPDGRAIFDRMSTLPAMDPAEISRRLGVHKASDDGPEGEEAD
ncbi:MAG TPA: hypothetical protein VFU19_16300 [Iamia sp.]|nr:hypothetical protein [Iamia sp.]